MTNLNILSLKEMMDYYRTCEYQKYYVPYLIDDIFDIKIFVNPQLLDGKKKTIGVKMPVFQISGH